MEKRSVGIDPALEEFLRHRAEEILSEVIDLCDFDKGTVVDQKSGETYTWKSMPRVSSSLPADVQNIKDWGPVGTWRLRTELSHSVDRVVELLWPIENTLRHSTSISKAENLVTLDEYCEIAYHQHKSPVPGVSKRDFCILRARRAMCDGSIVIARSSVDLGASLSRICPTRKGIVRGKLEISGYVFHPPVGEDVGGKCNVHYVIRTDPRGSIPKFLMEMTMKRLEKKFRLINDVLARCAKH